MRCKYCEKEFEVTIKRVEGYRAAILGVDNKRVIWTCDCDEIYYVFPIDTDIDGIDPYEL